MLPRRRPDSSQCLSPRYWLTLETGGSSHRYWRVVCYNKGASCVRSDLAGSGRCVPTAPLARASGGSFGGGVSLCCGGCGLSDRLQSSFPLHVLPPTSALRCLLDPLFAPASPSASRVSLDAPLGPRARTVMMKCGLRLPLPRDYLRLFVCLSWCCGRCSRGAGLSFLLICAPAPSNVPAAAGPATQGSAIVQPHSTVRQLSAREDRSPDAILFLCCHIRAPRTDPMQHLLSPMSNIHSQLVRTLLEGGIPASPDLCHARLEFFFSDVLPACEQLVRAASLLAP